MVYTFLKDGITQTQLPDGTERTVFPTGQEETKFADKRVEIKYPDKSTKVIITGIDWSKWFPCDLMYIRIICQDAG